MLRLGSQIDVDAQVDHIAPGRYVLVRGKPDIADPMGLWAVKIADWNPMLVNRLNGFDVLLVDVPLK